MLDGYLSFIKSEVTIEIGVWWDPGKLNLPVMFYAGWSYGPDSLKKMPPQVINRRLKAFCVSGKTYFYKEPGEQIDFNTEFNELIDECLKQAAALKKRSR
jgi:hypothetical protein